MKDKDYYGYSHLFELTMETPPKMINSLVTSYKAYNYLREEIVETIEKSYHVGITGIKIIASSYCQDDHGYLFDSEGNMTIVIFNFKDD